MDTTANDMAPKGRARRRRRDRRGLPLRDTPNERAALHGPDRWSILAIGAHPDDIEIGVGGTLSKLRSLGFDVTCVYLTRGERGGGDPAARECEAGQACACLGVSKEKVFFGDFADTAVQTSHETIAFLEQFATEDLFCVFIPSVNETHQDHRNAALACWSAFRRGPRVLAYESPSTTPQFQPAAFFNIRGHLARKWRALRCHVSQIAQGKMYFQYRAIVRLAEFRGAQNGIDYAEAFEVIRLQINPPWNVDMRRRPRRSVGAQKALQIG